MRVKKNRTITKNAKKATKSDRACLIIHTKSDILLNTLIQDIVFTIAKQSTTTNNDVFIGVAPGDALRSLWSIEEYAEN